MSDDQDSTSGWQDVDNSGKGVQGQGSLLGRITDKFIMIDLHTCGGLGPSIIRIFASTSDFVLSPVGHCLSYTELEKLPACHVIENYTI